MEGGGKGRRMAIFHKSRMSVTERSTIILHTTEKGQRKMLSINMGQMLSYHLKLLFYNY